MAHEWKVRDRFTLEFEVESVGGFGVEASICGHLMRMRFADTEMEHAKLIEPAPEPQNLDRTKPVRIKWSGHTGRIVGESYYKNQLVFEYDNGFVCIADESEFENIPEPKIKGRREAVLLSNGQTVWAEPDPRWCFYKVLGRKWVEIEAGDGAEEE